MPRRKPAWRKPRLLAVQTATRMQQRFTGTSCNRWLTWFRKRKQSKALPLTLRTSLCSGRSTLGPWRIWQCV